MAVTYELHRGLEALRGLRAEWERLDAATTAPYFQSWALAQAWTETLGQQVGCEPTVVVCRTADKTVGIFPAARIRRKGLSVLTWLGIPHVQDSGDVLFDRSNPDVLVEAFAHESLRVLQESIRGAVLHFGHVREDAVVFPALSGAFWQHGHGVVPVTHNRVDALPCGDGLSKQMRKSLRRKRNMMTREGGYLIDEIALGGEEGYELLSYLLNLKSAQRAQAGKPSDLLDEGALAFYRRQTELGADGRIVTLAFEGKPIAGMFDVVQHNCRYSIVLAFDAAYSRYSPGLVLEAEVVCGWLDTESEREFNFGWGDDAYKYHWHPTEKHLTTFIGKGPAGAAILSAMRLRSAFGRSPSRRTTTGDAREG